MWDCVEQSVQKGETMTGKEYMDEIRKIRRKVRALREQILKNTTLASSVKAIRYDIDKIQSSPDGERMTDLIAEIIAEEQKLHKEIAKLMVKEKEARDYLLKLKEEHEIILTLHYLDGISWDDIAQKRNYNEKYIYDLRKKALDELTEVLTKSDQI